MRRSVTVVTPASADPVTLSEANAWLRLDDGADDVTVSMLISAATASVEEYLRRSLLTRTLRLTLDAEPSRFGSDFQPGTYDLPVGALYGDLPRAIDLPKGPVRAISSVTTYDTEDAASTFGSSNYSLDSAGSRLVLAYGSLWPTGLRPRAAVEINYTAGYGEAASSVPQPIRTAILIHLATLYEQRGQCDDAMSMPPGAKQLLNQYRIMGGPRG